MQDNYYCFEHKKYGQIDVTAEEKFDELKNESYIRVWGIYFDNGEELHISFSYPAKLKMTELQIKQKVFNLME